MPRFRHVLVLVVDGSQSLDVMGPVEALHAATALADGPGYRVDVVSPDGGQSPSATASASP